jgi:nucleotide-binding universal stress UspA family protein
LRTGPFTNIVSAVDFTVSSAVALRTTLDLARTSGGRVTMVHALKNAPGRMVFSGGEALSAINEVHAEAANVAARLRREIPATAVGQVDSRVTTGDPSRGILDVASEVHADLIVMGAPPRDPIDELLFGSTLRTVVRGATSPVLVLPVVAGAHEWLVGATP